MKWKEFKKILPYIDVDNIDDDDTVLMESSFSKSFGIPPWLQQEIRAARRKVSPAPQETPSSSGLCSCGNPDCMRPKGHAIGGDGHERNP